MKLFLFGVLCVGLPAQAPPPAPAVNADAGHPSITLTWLAGREPVRYWTIVDDGYTLNFTRPMAAEPFCFLSKIDPPPAFASLARFAAAFPSRTGCTPRPDGKRSVLRVDVCAPAGHRGYFLGRDASRRFLDGLKRLSVQDPATWGQTRDALASLTRLVARH